MSLVCDYGFSHKLATEVLKDHPENKEALSIVSKPKFRVNNNYFNTKEEMDSFLAEKGVFLLV